MRHKYQGIILSLFLVMTGFLGLSGQEFTEVQKKEQCDKVIAAARYAWQGYTSNAFGYDDLRPVTGTGHNWYASSLMFTPVDAYSTFTLMGMKKEATLAQAFITTRLDFFVDMDVQIFEINIRLLGGLISAYELSGDRSFLDLAIDLGGRLLPAFRTKTGIPYRFVNLMTGEVKGPESNPAEAGTYLLELGKLTYYTGDSTFYNIAKNASLAIFKRRSKADLVGTVIDVNTGEWKNTESQIGARIDSYYEYLLKSWLMYGDKDLKKAWDISMAAIQKHLVRKTPKGTFMTRVNMNTGAETRSLYGALDAFCAGMMALAGDAGLASQIQEGNFYMWKRFNLEPEEFNFVTDSITVPYYLLRPENLESCFYLYRLTRDPKYQHMGKKMFDDILEHCKTPYGYAALRHVKTYEKDDSMESFFFAETLKYAYLLFAPESTLDLNKVVLNTEAHPIKRVKSEE
ncbi:MAG: glycoside hydrolase family 47 protein [Bacteroidales bacterium]